MRSPGLHSSSDGQRGTALVVTAVLGLLLAVIWIAAWRSTHDTIRVERFVVERQERADSIIVALAGSGDLLRTGAPPSDPYSCVFTITPGPDTYHCTALFEGAGVDTWDVTVTESTPTEIATLPPAPSTF